MGNLRGLGPVFLSLARHGGAARRKANSQTARYPTIALLQFLEEVGSFLAGLFRVVDGDLRGLLASLRYVLARVGRGVTGQPECFFRTVRRLDRNRFG